MNRPRTRRAYWGLDGNAVLIPRKRLLLGTGAGGVEVGQASPDTPAISNVTNTVHQGACVVTYTGGTGTISAVTVGGVSQTFTQIVGQVTITSLDIGDNRLGVLLDVVITDSTPTASSAFQITVSPRSGWSYTNLEAPITTTEPYIETSPPLAGGEQVEWTFTGGAGTVGVNGGITKDIAANRLDYRVHDGTEWGAEGVYSWQDAPLRFEHRTIPLKLVSSAKAVAPNANPMKAARLASVSNQPKARNNFVPSFVPSIIADAGVDLRVPLGATVQLNASASQGSSLAYLWVQTLGATVALDDDEIAAPTFTAPGSEDTLQFLLTVTDSLTQVRVDSVNVFVTADTDTEDLITVSVDRAVTRSVMFRRLRG